MNDLNDLRFAIEEDLAAANQEHLNLSDELTGLIERICYVVTDEESVLLDKEIAQKFFEMGSVHNRKVSLKKRLAGVNDRINNLISHSMNNGV